MESLFYWKLNLYSQGQGHKNCDGRTVLLWRTYIVRNFLFWRWIDQPCHKFVCLTGKLRPWFKRKMLNLVFLFLFSMLKNDFKKTTFLSWKYPKNQFFQHYCFSASFLPMVRLNSNSTQNFWSIDTKNILIGALGPKISMNKNFEKLTLLSGIAHIYQFNSDDENSISIFFS